MRSTLRSDRRTADSGAVPTRLTGRPGVRVVSSGSEREEIADLLGALPDRPDLERLFERQVEVPKLLRLMARQVSRRQIQDLLDSKDFEQDLQKLLL